MFSLIGKVTANGITALAGLPAGPGKPALAPSTSVTLVVYQANGNNTRRLVSFQLPQGAPAPKAGDWIEVKCDLSGGLRPAYDIVDRGDGTQGFDPVMLAGDHLHRIDSNQTTSKVTGWGPSEPLIPTVSATDFFAAPAPKSTTQAMAATPAPAAAPAAPAAPAAGWALSPV